MKMKNAFLFLGIAVMSIIFVTSCKKKSVTETEASTETIQTEVTKTSEPVDYEDIQLAGLDTSVPVIKSKEDVTYKDLFNLGNRVSISVDITEEELQKLEDDYLFFKENGQKIETYHRAKSVTIKLTNYTNVFTWTFDDVGIRQKGNTSRNSILNDDGSLNINHFKLSFDETFDSDSYGDDKEDWTGREDEREDREDREFLGLSGVDLKWNAVSDESHIREIYASKMYQAAGLITQYIGLSTFTMNRIDKNDSCYMGVFLLYEPATKSMIKRHLKNEDILDFGAWSEEKKGDYGCEGSSYGDLYRLGWSADLTYDTMYGNMIGYASEDGTYNPLYDCKTNKDSDYDHVLLKRLGYATSNGNYGNIEQYLDTTYFAATEAVSWLIGNPDDYRDDQNNTMIYLRRSDGKCVTIPLDNDRCLGVTRWWNPDGTGMTAKTIFDTTRGADGSDVFSIYTKTILAEENNYSKTVYLNYIKAFAVSKWCDGTYFNELYELARRTYNGSVRCNYSYVTFDKDSTQYNDYTFDSYMKLKIRNIDLTLDLGDVVTIDPLDIGSMESMEGYYGNLYVCGGFNDWKGTDYPFTYKGNGIYEITFSPHASGTQWYKIYDGLYWRVNWSIVDGKLIMHDMDAQTMYLKYDSVVTIVLDTINETGTVTVK